MITHKRPESFNEFRKIARTLLYTGIPPEGIQWTDSQQASLFNSIDSKDHQNVATRLHISTKELHWLKTVSLNSHQNTWNLLYKILWRLLANSILLKNPADPDVLEAERLRKQVTRDIHKMHAFVRFREVTTENGAVFIAWHEPDHNIVRAAIPFFVARFATMRWSILTPKLSAYWNLKALEYGPGVSNDQAPKISDEKEEWWKKYYESTFNPARLKIKMMKREMPLRYWKSMPETLLIPELIKSVSGRVSSMVERESFRAEIPNHVKSLDELRESALACTACPLSKSASCTVFGTGNLQSQIMLVGEQPGDEEDLTGLPFIGPAGKLLDQAITQAGLARNDLYITNAVKHFHFEQRGKRRLHKKPDGDHILACKPWLDAEIRMLAPRVIVCLGASACQAVLGQQIAIKDALGQEFLGNQGQVVLVTYHPSAALRRLEALGKQKIIESIVDTLKRAAV